MDRVNVAEAAQRLRVSQDAIYKRIKRGTIPWDKDDEGKTVVYVKPLTESTDATQSSTDAPTDGRTTSTDEPPPLSTDASTGVLLDELRDRVSFLEEELRRKDTILMSLVQRIPELEPPGEGSPEPREGPQATSEERRNGEAPPDMERRSWLHRFFFGP